MSKYYQPATSMIPLQYLKEMCEGLTVPENYVLFAKFAEIAQLYQTRYEYETSLAKKFLTLTPEESNQNLKSEIKAEYHETPSSPVASAKIEEETVESPVSNSQPSKTVTFPTTQTPVKPRKHNSVTNVASLVKTLQCDAYYGRAVLEQFIGQDKTFITFYPSFAAQDEIREAELQEMAETFAKNGKIDKRSSIKSSFVKNFSKLNGDHFANFVVSKYKLDSLKKIFKDKSSCTKLSEYLDGTTTIEGISTKAFIRMYFEFIEEIDVKEIDKSKVGTKSLRTCYKLIFNYMKSIVSALREWQIYDKVNFVQIEKFWPTVEFSIKWDQDQ